MMTTTTAASSLPAAATSDPPFHFLHLTDLHLQPPGSLLRGGLDAAEPLAQALASIARRHGPGGVAPPVAFAALTGDLTRDGEPEAYQALRRLIATLPCPAHLMLGNHDDRAAFRATFPEAPVDEAGFVQQALPTPAGLCLMLDTLDQGRPEGRLCPKRLGWLTARLADSGEEPVMLFLHHPPLPVGIASMDAIALKEPEALWEVLAPHRARIRHLFHGHLHRPIAGSWRGIPLSSLRGTAFEVAYPSGPGAIGVTTRMRPSYGLVRVQDGDVLVHSLDLDE
jgi:3',5'-cyclic AMP phosphodiesterase CpdA